MAESAGDLTFTFEADLSGLTRAAAGAGQVLDQLSRRAADWSSDTATAMAAPFGSGNGGPLRLTGGLSDAARALTNPVRPLAPTTSDDASAKELAHLADQLALLKTTGTAHDAILERMQIETEQARLGVDATDAQKAAVAGLVGQIDAAKAAQTTLKTEQAATNQAWRAGSAAAAQGIEAMVIDGARLGDVARSLLSGFARQGLSAALTGSGPFAGLFGTAGANGAPGGLFGALQGLFGTSLRGGGGADPSFAGLYAGGGSIAAGRWGIVGEKGAEVVAGPASVVPLGKLPSAPPSTAHQTINFNVTTPDAPSFARSEGQMAALLGRMVSRGGRNS